MKRPSSSETVSAHILLVDDNKLGLAARKAVLEEIEYRVTTISSPHEALERFSETKFDLVVTDYRMPRMNGVELIEQLRQQAPAIPVILLSGFADALGLDEKNTGADIVIQKSANEVTQLVRAVRRLLRRSAPKKPPVSHRAHSRARKTGS